MEEGNLGMEKRAKTANSIKGFLPAKIAAWILLVAAEILFLASTVGAAIMGEEDIYEYSRQEMRQAAAEQVGERYSIMVLANMGTDYNRNYFNEKNFQYGIIQADSLDGMDLADLGVYLENNFKGPVVPDKCMAYQASISEHTEYYYSDSILNNTYYIRSHAGEEKNYFVVSYVELDALYHAGSVWDGDLYVQMDHIVNMVYSLRYSIYAVITASFVAIVLLLVFLCSGAGHRRGLEGVVLRYVDKIPFDLFAVGIFTIIGILSLLPMELGYGRISVFEIFLLAVDGIAILLVSNETIFSFAARVKAGKWWRNTLLFRILSWGYREIRKICTFCERVFGWQRKKGRQVVENLPLYAKAAVASLFLALVEFLVILGTEYDIGYELLFWFIEKGMLYLFFCTCLVQMKSLLDAGRQLAAGESDYKVDTNRLFWDFKKHGEDLNRIGEGITRAVNERLKSERFKTELITNVSHDIKTPLTSIINYVDLLGKEELKNPLATEYLEVLNRQSHRLKKLIEDLMEASKASTGNLAVNMERCEAGVFLMQVLGEYEERIQLAQLELVTKTAEEPVYIMVDGRHFWRVIDNLMSNICKYAQPGTRIYIDLLATTTETCFIFRNTSKYQLNITGEELMERFVRGDSSRNTEGNGLGLNIAKSLTELMGGKLLLVVDGDLFKIILSFKRAPNGLPEANRLSVP